MKRSLFFISYLLASLAMSAQEQKAYRPFVEDGKVWIVRNYPGYVGNDEYGNNKSWLEYYYFDGDTIIGGQTCKQMKRVINANYENWVNWIFTPSDIHQYYIGAFYEQDRKVYYARDGKQQLELLYDFTLSSNDVVSSSGYPLVVKKISGAITGFKGTYYEFWDGDQLKNRWFEGVGSESWPNINYPFEYDGATGELLACMIGDEIIYYKSDEGEATPAVARKRFDFTHTIKTKPKARTRSVMSTENQSLYGEYDDLQLEINLHLVDDAYQVSITDETGKIVYEKTINAGNIVGLNIDISSYAKGCYSVTFENSQEIFTGVFEAQTTGIEEVKSKKEDVRKIIYNLHGQRLSTLQKGVNIVNGRKVYVK